MAFSKKASTMSSPTTPSTKANILLNGAGASGGKITLTRKVSVVTSPIKGSKRSVILAPSTPAKSSTLESISTPSSSSKNTSLNVSIVTPGRNNTPQKTPTKKPSTTPAKAGKSALKSSTTTPSKPLFDESDPSNPATSSFEDLPSPKSSNNNNDNDNDTENIPPTTSSANKWSVANQSPSVKTSISNLKNSVILPLTKKAYSIINTATGQIGGNASGGAIYGELTIKSMQKIVQMMKDYQGLNTTSCFIDVGAGLGKPNVHVACDPGVMFSYGVEHEEVRWNLSLTNLKGVMAHAVKDTTGDVGDVNCILCKEDIMNAKSFDPFTHVYMFDIGFPHYLFEHLSNIFNKAQSKWLVCYHGPKLMIDKYGFDVEFMFQVSTAMHGSGEGHTGYFYKRTGVEDFAKESGKVGSSSSSSSTKAKSKTKAAPCDPLFSSAYATVKAGNQAILDWTAKELSKFETSGRPVRERKQRVLTYM